MFPLSRVQATDIVRDIAKTSSRWSINVPYDQEQDWRRIVNRRQVELCLREGYILNDVARADEHGNYRFQIARVCAGLDVVIDVALQFSPPLLPKIFVVGIKGDHINTSEDEL